MLEKCVSEQEIQSLGFITNERDMKEPVNCTKGKMRVGKSN